MAGLTFTAAVAVSVASPLGAGGVSDPVRRVRGIIHQTNVWSGHVIITGDAAILGAEVSVAAGTVIEFVGDPSAARTVLTVGDEEGRLGGSLVLQGAAEAPIRIRVRQGSPPGRIVVHLRGPSTSEAAETPQAMANGLATNARRFGAIDWRHVRFESPGEWRAEDGPPNQFGADGATDPAVTIHVDGPATGISVSDCEFHGVGRLAIRTGGRAPVRIERNHFTSRRERVGIEVIEDPTADSPASVYVRANTLDGAIHVRAANANVEQNVLVGPNACIVVDSPRGANTRIAGNYVHCTAGDEHYALNVTNPAAVIEDNVLAGGTYVVLHGSKRMRGNVLMADGAAAGANGSAGGTRVLVNELPAGAVFEGNLLLGPVPSMVIPQPDVALPGSSTDVTVHSTIRNNVFDGIDQTARAIHLNAPGREWTRIEVSGNVFLRVRSVVFEEMRMGGLLAWADQNVVAPPPVRPYDGARSGPNPLALISLHDDGNRNPWAIETLSRLGSPRPLVAIDADVLRKRAEVVEVRRELRRAYRPADHDVTQRPDRRGAVGPGRDGTGGG